MKTSKSLHQNDLFQMESPPSMSSPADSHVRTSPMRENRLVLKAHALVFGENTHDLLAKLDPSTQSWRTCQRSFLEIEGNGLERFSETWPESGTMQDGVAYRQPTVVRSISATGSGYWPTPTRHIAQENAYPADLRRHSPGLGTEVHTREANNMRPTPTANGNHNRKGASATSGDGLATAVKMWPTPASSDNRDRGNLSTPAVKRRRQKGKQLGLSMVVSEKSGALNPTWVEALMGYPHGWTEVGSKD